MVSWNRLRSVYERTPERHAKAAQLLGFVCPSPVFLALFHDRYQDPDLDRVLREVDLSTIEWVLDERSGIALRQVCIDRAFQPAVDEAYRDALVDQLGLKRTDVVPSWRKVGTWIAPPILMNGEVFGSAVRDVLLVGATRLGSLRALLDQGVVAEKETHCVWLGQPSAAARLAAARTRKPGIYR